jgi:hypothetical protein
MPRAEFEEKEYEFAFNLELASGRGAFGAVFSAGQVLEKIVGYDAVALPDRRNRIWQVLRIRRPPGVKLLPHMWDPGINPASGELPSSPESLILQYKRPEYLSGPRAAQWRLWRQPYFRFARSSEQHAVLRRLERNLRSDAIVRYAAPAFWRRADLEVAHLGRYVLVRSGFVSPETIGRHRVWTYVRPGQAGRANPASRPLPFDTVDDIVANLLGTQERRSTELAVTDNGFEEHLRRVGAAARYREPVLRRSVEEWISAVVRSDILLPAETVRQLRDLASIASLVSRIRANWYIVDAAR